MEIEVRLLKASDDPSDDITVSEWHVEEGDPVTAGDDLVDVDIDKIDETIPAPVSGILTKIVAAEGDTVAPNALLGVITSALPKSS